MNYQTIEIPYTTETEWDDPKWVEWLVNDAARELSQEAFYNVVAQYVMRDGDTTLECTLKEAGLE